MGSATMRTPLGKVCLTITGILLTFPNAANSSEKIISMEATT